MEIRVKKNRLAFAAPLLAGAVLWAAGHNEQGVRRLPLAGAEPRVFQWIRYDAGRRALRLKSSGGFVREYEQVPAETAFDLLSSEDRPAYFSRFVRDQYPCRVVPGEEP